MIKAIIGLLFAFIIPGLLLTLIFFNKKELLEKIILTLVLSISFTTLVGLLLGFNELTFRLTGGLKNLWWFVLFLNLGLLIGYLIKKKKLSFK